MSLRTTLAATAAAAILLAGAGAVIAVTSNGSAADSSESTTTTSAAATDRATYDAGVAGTVTVVNDGGVLRFAAITPADGWRSDIEVPRGREIEVNFTNDGRRVDFNAELEDGEIRVRVRDSDFPTSDDSLADVVTAPASTSEQASPSGNVHSVAAGAAGVVHYIFDGSLLVTSVDTANGWVAEIEQQRGHEIEVVFTSNGSRIDVEVEIEDGAPRERVRARDDRNDADFRHDDRGDDDRHGDDDRSGHGGGDDDNSGHGGGDDDNSGRGGGDDD